MYKDVRSFVEALEAAGELERVTAEADPVLEIAARADAASKTRAPHEPGDAARRTDPAYFDRGGPALLFENVRGSDFPLLINAYGSYRRMEMAFGAPLEEIAGRIGELVKPEPPRGLGEAIAKARQFAPVLKIGPRRTRGDGACQDVVLLGDAIDLTRLPILRCWPHDGDEAGLGYPAGINDGVPGLGHPEIEAARWAAEFRGRYITLAGIHTVHAEDADEEKPKSHNIGMYRVQLFGKDRLSMHWHMHHDGASHWRSWKRRGEPMPVAIALGGPSVLPYAATAPLPPGISELLMAGYLNTVSGGGGIRLCRAKTVPLWVPADAEIVIEGLVSHEAGFPGWDPREPDAGELGPGAVFEGPFGDHTGFYSLPDRYPTLRVTAVTHRRGAIYPTTVVGLPPQEDYFLGKATERLFLPLLKVLIPDVLDYDLPMFGAFHNCAFVRIRKAYPLHARRVMHAIWGAGQMAWTKSIFVVDEDVDVHDQRAVMEAAARFCRPWHDVERVRGPLDILDHAAPELAAGGKVGFDCTPPRPGEGEDGLRGPRSWDETRSVEIACGVEGVLAAAVPRRSPGWLVVRADRGFGEDNRTGLGRRVTEAVTGRLAEMGSATPFVLVVGRDVDIEGAVPGPFHWLANSDPGRDVFVFPGGAAGGAAAVMGWDATPKSPADSGEWGRVRPWPPVLPGARLAADR